MKPIKKKKNVKKTSQKEKCPYCANVIHRNGVTHYFKDSVCCRECFNRKSNEEDTLRQIVAEEVKKALDFRDASAAVPWHQTPKQSAEQEFRRGIPDWLGYAAEHKVADFGCGWEAAMRHMRVEKCRNS